MNKVVENIRLDDDFYKLLRLSLRLTQEFPVDVSAEAWRRLYQTAVRQSLVGVCYQGMCQLPEDSKPTVEIAMQWASEAESIKGMNELLYQEAARLTREFAEKGHRTAILKGQANARLYPNKYVRQPGDIDIWVEGGRESVLELLPNPPKFAFSPKLSFLVFPLIAFYLRSFCVNLRKLLLRYKLFIKLCCKNSQF